MTNSDAIRAIINAYIKTNRKQEITGKILNSVLNQMVTDKDAGISEEAELRAAEDGRIEGLINKEIGDRKSADAEIQDALTKEVAARKDADTTINNALSEEKTARQDADTNISNALSDEQTARENADTTIINAIRDAFSKGYLFAGVATTDTNPGTPEGKVFYIANGKGMYTNFGGLEVTDDDDFAIFTYDNAWAKSNVAISSSGGGIAETMLETTYAELKSMRDNGTLTPGMWYRITDYVCTTTQSNTISAGNKFDVIVLATSTNSLSEQARAINHTPQEGETDYFANSNLSAWQIWYCIDNNTNRFAWADTTNGKGVIYRMIDESLNDVPYDFKNIKFKHPINTTTYPDYYYTFTDSELPDMPDITINGDGSSKNIIKASYPEGIQTINNILILGYGLNNYFGYDCNNICLNGFSINNFFGSGCQKILLGDECGLNYFASCCSDISFGISCKYNYFNNGCGNITFGDYCHYNTFGINCTGIYSGGGLSRSSFGNLCQGITFGSSKSNLHKNYQYIHFENGCSYIKFTNTSSSGNVQNYRFSSGVYGEWSNNGSKSITVNGEINRNYETKVAKNSSGTLKIYCEADLVQ